MNKVVGKSVSFRGTWIPVIDSSQKQAEIEV